MSDNTVAKTLTIILDNQSRRRQCALDGLTDEMLHQKPGGDCKPIYNILGHIVHLYAFQMKLLGETTDQMPELKGGESLDQINEIIAAGEQKVIDAVVSHDTNDWFAKPDTPREGPWGDEPTMARVSRPINDVVNHIGSIRAIRRILGNPAEKTQ